jgi:hypothetical protein
MRSVRPPSPRRSFPSLAPALELAGTAELSVIDYAHRLEDGREARLRIRGAGGTLGDLGRTAVREVPPGELPPLLRGQQIVGKVVRIEAERPPARPAIVEVPYDEALVADTRYEPDELVVLQLDTRRTRYRELHPFEVDRDRRVLRVRVAGFSYLFPGTPGIEVIAPRFAPTAAGEVLHYTNATTVDLYGRAIDPAARVSVPAAQLGWSALGWFVQRFIPLPRPIDNLVRVTAEVPGLVPHDLDLLVRKRPADKRVASASALHLPTLEFDDTGIAHVGHVLGEPPPRPPAGTPPSPSQWPSRVALPTPRLFWWRPWTGGEWLPVELFPGSAWENELAKVIIAAVERSFGVAIALDEGRPEGTRAASALRAFFETGASAVMSDEAWLGFLDGILAAFHAGNLTISPVVPLHRIGAERTMGAAFVMGTAEGWAALQADPHRAWMRRAYLPRTAEGLPVGEVHAGRLSWARVIPGQVERVEAVADGIWCAELALRPDPRTGEPVILALARHEAEGAPRAALVLLSRAADGTWARTPVDDTRGYLSADFVLDAGGAPFIVAAALDEASGGTRLFAIARRGEEWETRPLEWSLGDGVARTDGMWPRVTRAGERLAVAFVTGEGGALSLVVGNRDGAGWDFRALVNVGITELFGAPRRANAAERAGDVVTASGLSSFQFRPAIHLDERGTPTVAWGHGILRLADVPPGGPPQLSSLDIDRLTGFGPALTPQSNGSLAVAYNDPFGAPAAPAGSQADVHYLALDAVSPVEPPARRGGAAPAIRSASALLTGFSTFRPLEPGAFLDAAAVDANVRAIVFHRRFHASHAPEGVSPVPWVFRCWYTHNRIADMLWRLQSRPALTEITVDNRDFPAESIGRLDFMVPGRLLTLPARFAADLGNGVFPDELFAVFRQAGLAVGDRGRVSVTPAAQSRGATVEWDIVVADPFNEGSPLPDGSLPLDLHYFARRTSAGLDVSIRPLVSVGERKPDGSGDLVDTTDVVMRHRPFGLDQRVWDEIAARVGTDLEAIVQFQRVEGVRLTWIRLSDLRVGRPRPVSNVRPQQGGLRVALEIGRIRIHGEVPVPVLDSLRFNAQSMGPSRSSLEFAPFVNRDRELQWHLRDSRATLARFDVDVRLEDVLLVNVLGLLISPIRLLHVNTVADEEGRMRFHRDIGEADTSSLADYVQPELDAYSRAALLDDAARRLDAVHLEGPVLTYWYRRGDDEVVPPADLRLAPTGGLTFGRVERGSPARIRNVLVENAGGVASAVHRVALAGGEQGFSIADMPRTPFVLEPGHSEVVQVRFDPAGGSGDRAGELTLTYDDNRERQYPLGAFVPPPPAPDMEVFPDILTFGLVSPARREHRRFRILNRGLGRLKVTTLTVAAFPGSEGVFTLSHAAPLHVAPGGEVEVTVTYAPAPGPAHVDAAAIVVEGNDPQTPGVGITVRGHSLGDAG